MIENLSSINYELNYKKDNNDIETIQDNLLGEVETGIQILCDSDIDSLTKDSPLHILRALYTCKLFAICDENKQSFITQENASKILGYKSDFANIFVYGKDSLNDTYLQARKALYKTMINLREEREQEHKEEQNRISQLSYEEYSQEQREKERQERQERFSNKNTANKDLHFILESKDKNNIIIFLDSANSLSNLIHIHNERIDIFTKDYTRLDIQELAKAYQDYGITLDSLHSNNTQIFLYSQLLLGSKETPNNPLFFGELDKEGVFRESKPVYHLSGETDYDTKDSKESFTQTLQIFLNGNTLTLLNYSLLDSSLNIKLECNSSESKAIQEREKAQREQQKQDSQTKDSIQSTAMLHPILEDNEIKCPHNGVVKLKSNKGKSFTSKGIPMVLESDLLHSSIMGCTNPILSGGPCTSVAVILPSARGLKKFNDDYPIMQDLVASGCLTDKGFPLICTPKENTFKINSPNPSSVNTQDKEALASSISLSKPILRLHYKIHSHQKDNLPIYRIKIQDSIKESHTNSPLDSLSIDIAKDTKALDDTQSLDSNLQDILSTLYANLKDTYTKHYAYHYLSLQLDSNALILILLIPQSIPKVYKELYKDYTYKDYGIGKYHYLYNYCTHTMLDIQDYTQIGLESNPSNATILTLHTPYKAQRLELQLANGLDSLIESKDRQRQAKQATTQSKQKDSQQDKGHNTEQQIIDSLLTLTLINGGYKEKYWGFGEEDTQANLLQTTDKIDKDSKATQENRDKQILEIYFSYGDDTTRLQGDSRHTQDVNLHIITQGYSNGEEVEVKLESSLGEVLIVRGIIQDNQAIIMNPFKEQ